MTDATAQQVQLECQKCGAWYPAKISGEMLETLEDAGVAPRRDRRRHRPRARLVATARESCAATAAN